MKYRSTVFPAPTTCYEILDCPDSYLGNAGDISLSKEGDPTALQLNYQAGSFAGTDSVCVLVCDTFAICDTFRYAFAILQDTIGLPFMDDFSYSGPFPAEDLWLDRDVFINRTMAVDPPSIGVATFDGLDGQGIPYGGDYGVSDHLTSIYVDLSDKQTNEVFLTYWLQKKGLVDKPEPQDSIVLEFKTIDGEWQYITASIGIPVSRPNTEPDSFLFFRQPVTNEFKYNGFQFRFKNYSNRTGILDTWHLDYVRLDDIQTDSTFSDVAFANAPRPILHTMTALPWRHFKGREEAELRRDIEVGLFNFSGETLNASPSNVNLQELNSNIQLFGNGGVTLFNGVEANIPSGEKVARSYSLSNDATGFPSVWADYFQIMSGPAFDNFERLEFDMTYTLSNTSQQTGPGYEGVLRNDQVSTSTVFDNYFAYDDGTAEAGFVAQEGNLIAVQYTAAVADSLRAVQFHFPHTSVDISTQRFDLKVWIDDPNTEPVYDQLSVQPYYTDLFFDTLQGYTTYVLVNEFGEPTPVPLPAGDFYIGWEQITACDGLQCIAVGYDRNSPNGKQFIRLRRTERFDSLDTFFPEGALMIRPIVGSVTPMATVGTNDQLQIPEKVAIFPNPARDYIRFRIQSGRFVPAYFELLNSFGQVVRRGRTSGQASTMGLSGGLYYLRVSNRERTQIATGRFTVFE